ncbi:DUF2938 family protein [Desulfobacterales bacterium HSG17]|nr:DUF2938 family protein [Desulfobacterales bacterium HSG17]
MRFFIEIVLMGIFATLVMDVLAVFFSKRNLIHKFIEPDEIGRWFLYIFKGKFTHENISKTPSLKNEKAWCLISHYLIGIVLAGILLTLEIIEPVIREQVWVSLVFGIVTVLLPWCWLLPSIGLGFMALKSPSRPLIIRTNLINHTNFGVGLFIWGIVIRPLF